MWRRDNISSVRQQRERTIHGAARISHPRRGRQTHWCNGEIKVGDLACEKNRAATGERHTVPREYLISDVAETNHECQNGCQGVLRDKTGRRCESEQCLMQHQYLTRWQKEPGVQLRHENHRNCMWKSALARRNGASRAATVWRGENISPLNTSTTEMTTGANCTCN